MFMMIIKNSLKKKKTMIISSSIIVGVLALIILLSFTVFVVKNVRVDIRSSTQNFTVSEEEIIESSGIKNNSCVFFQKKSKNISKLEKKYPYIKVVNIETAFPSKIILHIVERSEVYCFEYKGKFLICDNELKVLRIEDEFSSEQDNAILVKGVDIVEKQYAPADFLKVKNFADIYEKLYRYNRNLSEQCSIIKEIEFEMENDPGYKKNTLTANLTLFNGQLFKIKNCDRALSEKTKLFIDVYSQEFTYIGKTITTANEEEVVLTEENLLSATIQINNYYDLRNHKETDCNFNIILN